MVGAVACYFYGVFALVAYFGDELASSFDDSAVDAVAEFSEFAAVR